MKIKIVMTYCFSLILFTGFSQNKKEQIEALNFSLDSLNSLLVSERLISNEKSNEINNLKKQLIILNKHEIESQKEINQLKIELIQMSNEFEKTKICNEFMNYQSYTNLGELNKLQSCSPPSFIKSEFYRYYYEVFLIRQLRNDFTLNTLSDLLLIDLLKKRKKEIESRYLDQIEESEILNSITSLDRQFNTENYSEQKTNISQTFSEMLKNFYFGELSDEYIINVYDKFVLIFYNLSGAGTGSNVTQLYEVKNNTIFPIDVDENILSSVEMKMVKHFGKECILSRDISITKTNGQYEVTCTIGRVDDPECCGSGSIKFLTTDFNTYNLNSLMWGIKNSEGIVSSWKPN